MSMNKEILELATDWHKWCRLCAKEDPYNNINIFTCDAKQRWNTRLPAAIGKFFWVNVNNDDELSNVLCIECHTLIESLINFSERVEHVQNMFKSLNNAKKADIMVDLQSVRQQYNLLDEEWQHIIRFEEEEAFEADEEQDGQCGDNEDIESYDNEVELLAEIEEEVAQEFIETKENNNCDDHVNDNGNEIQMDDETGVDGDYIPATAEEEEEESIHLKTQYEIILDEECSDLVTEEKSTIDDYNKTNIYKNENENKIKLDEGSKIIEFDSLSADDLIEQIDEREQEKTVFKCSVCFKIYKKPLCYKKHMKEEHAMVPNDMPNYECKICNTTFNSKSRFEIHNRIHLNSKEKAHHECLFCAKKFTTLSSLKQHYLSVHESQRPFTCDFCGKKLKTMAALNEHKLVHTDEQPFECGICRRRFKNKARLRIHSDVHTKNGYVCSLCGLSLNTKRTLKMHMAVHTEEKQFKCNVCDAAFKRSKTLKSHLILHTGLRPYVCNFCNKTFTNGSNCRMHKRKAHPKELAKEEAQGKKVRTKTPLLVELRETAKNIMIPNKLSCKSGGLSMEKRALLIAAENLEKKRKSLLTLKIEKQTKDNIEIENIEVATEGTTIEENICEYGEEI